MITEVLLALPIIILFFISCQFRHLIKAMVDVGDTLNDFPGDIVDTPKETRRIKEFHKQK